MDISKYQYLWQEEKSDWALVDSPYGYGIINIRTHMMLVLNNHELECALIKKMEEAGNSKYASVADAFETNEND